MSNINQIFLDENETAKLLGMNIRLLKQYACCGGGPKYEIHGYGHRTYNAVEAIRWLKKLPADDIYQNYLLTNEFNKDQQHSIKHAPVRTVAERLSFRKGAHQ